MKKTFPNSFFTISNSQFNYFLKGLFNSDGSKRRKTYVYSTTSKELADRLQALGSINDKVFSLILNTNEKKENLKPLYRLNLNTLSVMPHINDSRSNRFMNKVHYKGYVYCATISTGLLIVRRNNKVVLCGNCSPLEHICFTFGIEGVSRITEIQLIRHRIGVSYSIQSGRYVNRANPNYITPPRIKSNKLADKIYQNICEQSTKAYNDLFLVLMLDMMGYAEDEISVMSENKRIDIVQELNTTDRVKYNIYEKMCVEDARYASLQSLSTKIIVTMNARALINLFDKRCCNRAQWEIRDMSDEMLKQVRTIAPSLFNHTGASCTYSKCTEGEMCCGNPRLDLRI